MRLRREVLIGVRHALRRSQSPATERQVWFHIGAHKTGTTTLQHFLEANRARLPLSLEVVPRRNRHLMKMSELTAAPRSLAAAERLQPMLSTLTENICTQYQRVPNLLISHEGLPGPMPGRPALPGLYPFAGPLLQAMVLGSRKAGFAPNFVFYTRDFADWQASLYRYRFRDQPDRAYAPKRFREATRLPKDWAQQIAELRLALGAVPLHVLSFEEDRSRGLMGRGLLDLLDIPETRIARLRSVRPRNVTDRETLLAR